MSSRTTTGADQSSSSSSSSLGINPESRVLGQLLESVEHHDSDDHNDDDAESSSFCALSDISSVRAWDFSWPTLTRRGGRNFTPRHTYASDAPLFQALRQHNGGVTYSLLHAVGAVPLKSSDKPQDDETPPAPSPPQTVVLYGGALVDLVLRRDHEIHDWDLRLIGSEFVGNQERCLAAGRAFVDNLLAWMRRENDAISMRNARHGNNDDRNRYPLMDLQKFTVSRCHCTLTVTVPTRGIQLASSSSSSQYHNDHPVCPENTVLQFTFAPYRSVSQLLARARPYCTRIAVWQGRVVLTPIARYCLESCCIVLDTTSLTHCQLPPSPSPKEEEHTKTKEEGTLLKNEVDDEKSDKKRTAEQSKDKPKTTSTAGERNLVGELQRTMQYFIEKGFDVVLPDLDMSKVPRRNLKFTKEVLDLPHLTIVFDDIQGCKIVVDKVQVGQNSSFQSVEGGHHRGCDGYAHDMVDVDFHDGYNAATDLNASSVIHHNLKCLIAGVFDRFQFFTEGEVVDPIFDFCPKLTPRMVQFCFQTVRTKFDKASTMMPIQVVLDYFAATPPQQVFDQLVLQPVRVAMAQQQQQQQGSNRRTASGKKFKLDTRVLDAIIEKEERHVIQNKLPVLRENMVARGLNQFKLDFAPRGVTSKVLIAEALYGPYLTKIETP